MSPIDYNSQHDYDTKQIRKELFFRTLHFIKLK